MSAGYVNMEHMKNAIDEICRSLTVSGCVCLNECAPTKLIESKESLISRELGKET